MSLGSWTRFVASVFGLLCAVNVSCKERNGLYLNRQECFIISGWEKEELLPWQGMLTVPKLQRCYSLGLKVEIPVLLGDYISLTKTLTLARGMWL